MPIFAVRRMDEIKGMQQTFYKLAVDGVCLLDDIRRFQSLKTQFINYINRQ